MKNEIKMIFLPVIILTIFATFLLLKDTKSSKDKIANHSKLLRKENNYTKGPQNARVSIVEFFDPECGGCAAFYPILKAMEAEYPKDIQITARYMLIHKNSYYAALALEGAGKQGRFWEMYSILLERQEEWSQVIKPVKDYFEEYAKELTLNLVKFNQSYNDETIRKTILHDMEDAESLKVSGTPTIFVNGQLVKTLSYQSIKAAIEDNLKKSNF